MSAPDRSSDHLKAVGEEFVVWREVDGEAVVLDLRTSRYLSLNEAARLMWAELVRGTTRVHLEETLATVYELEPDDAARDVAKFLAQCRERLLLA